MLLGGQGQSVPGTTFQRGSSRTAITPNLAAHVVGSVGAITADELHQLGAPHTASSQVGRTGLENITIAPRGLRGGRSPGRLLDIPGWFARGSYNSRS